MTESDQSLFAEPYDDFYRGFTAGVLWQKLREDHDRLDWDLENADVNKYVRMGEALGYRVQVKDSTRAGYQRLVFTSTLGADHG